MRFMHYLSGFTQHRMFVLSSKIYRISYTADIQTAALFEADNILHFQPLLRIGVFVGIL